MPCQLLQAADELEGYHAVGVMKGQRIGRHCTYVNTLHTEGMLGNVSYGRTNTVLVDLKAGRFMSSFFSICLALRQADVLSDETRRCGLT